MVVTECSPRSGTRRLASVCASPNRMRRRAVGQGGRVGAGDAIANARRRGVLPGPAPEGRAGEQAVRVGARLRVCPVEPVAAGRQRLAGPAARAALARRRPAALLELLPESPPSGAG